MGPIVDHGRIGPDQGGWMTSLQDSLVAAARAETDLFSTLEWSTFRGCCDLQRLGVILGNTVGVNDRSLSLAVDE